MYRNDIPASILSRSITQNKAAADTTQVQMNSSRTDNLFVSCYLWRHNKLVTYHLFVVTEAK
jgi:hypothetical protein